MRSVLFVYAQLIGFVSTIFMAFVFYNEAILGRGVLYVEPNRTIASTELAMTLVGLVLLGVCMLGSIIWTNHPFSHKHDDEEAPAGYPRSGVPYQ